MRGGPSVEAYEESESIPQPPPAPKQQQHQQPQQPQQPQAQQQQQQQHDSEPAQTGSGSGAVDVDLDFISLPASLDARYETLRGGRAMQATILKAAAVWLRRFKPSLLAKDAEERWSEEVRPPSTSLNLPQPPSTSLKYEHFSGSRKPSAARWGCWTP